MAGDINNEENWNILPNGTILTVDSMDRQFVRDLRSGREHVGKLRSHASEPGGLLAAPRRVGNSKEVGPGVLRPDGTLIYFSGNSLGQNAVYDTATGTWSHTAAMDFPLVAGQTYHFSVADGPASLLPNGNVLVMASPVINGDPFNTPSHFYEFDGTTLIQVADSPNAASFISYQGRMLLLPTGEVLLTAYNQCPPCGGTPAVSDVAALLERRRAAGCMASGDHHVARSGDRRHARIPISGTLFTGFSEGASYGDDAQASTNYPLVRIRNIGTGHVFYARTHGHSRMGVVAVGDPTVVTTQFRRARRSGSRSERIWWWWSTAFRRCR